MNSCIFLILLVIFISSCASAPSERKDSNFESIFHTKMRDAVTNNSGHILTPNEKNVGEYWSKLKVRDTYKFKHKTWTEQGWNDKGHSLITNSFYEFKDGKYIFSRTVNGLEDNPIYFDDGREYKTHGSIDKPMRLFGDCSLHKLGDCTYAWRGVERKLNVKFNDGVWITTFNFGNKQFESFKVATKYSVYDRGGVELYSWTKRDDTLQEEITYEELERVN